MPELVEVVSVVGLYLVSALAAAADVPLSQGTLLAQVAVATEQPVLDLVWDLMLPVPELGSETYAASAMSRETYEAAYDACAHGLGRLARGDGSAYAAVSGSESLASKPAAAGSGSPLEGASGSESPVSPRELGWVSDSESPEPGTASGSG